VVVIGLIVLLFELNVLEKYVDFELKEAEHRIKKFYPKKDSDIQTVIPLSIHQTYFNTKLNTTMFQACMTIHYMNPEYDYHFYDDVDCKEYIQRHYPEYVNAYQLLVPGAYKADLFRYLLLYREGGVYMDCKSATIRPLREMIHPNVSFAAFRDRPPGAILNSFMACTKGHPILKMAIDQCIKNIETRYYGINPLDITGPQLLGRVFNRYLRRDEMTDVKPGMYSSQHGVVTDANSNAADIQIIGSFYVIGTGDNEFEALVDQEFQPLVSKSTPNYYKNPNRNNYALLWDERKVYKVYTYSF
jgi:mannosyltransferase OCH1-like enzyme